MLEIRGLTKTYTNGVRALDGVDLDIDTGLFGLLGPNGSGKSTLMRTLATLQTADAGHIHFDGHDIFTQPREHRRGLGYLPQEFGVYPGVSALDLLDHLALLKGLTDRQQRREQVDALLARTNLYTQRKQAVSSFSGGMRRRFGIAQALLGAPRLVIVDEPTAGLDPEERHRFHDLLAEIGEQRVVVLSTHIVEDVRQLCLQMAILHQGRVVAQGEPRQLVDALRGRVWSRPVERAALDAYRSRFHVLSTQLQAGQTCVRVLTDGSNPDEQPDTSGGEPFRTTEPGLEDLYFSVLEAA